MTKTELKEMIEKGLTYGLHDGFRNQELQELALKEIVDRIYGEEDEDGVLDHIMYNPETDMLQTDRAIEVTLNSLHLGEQHKMSSGAENVFFSNNTSNIDFFPMWAGMKDQSILGNQIAGEGVIAPSGRTYGDYSEIEPNGIVDLSGSSLPYNTATYFAQSISGLGIKFHIAEPIVAEDTFFTYKLFVGDIQVYEQTLEVTSDLSIGDLVDWYFDHPVEIHAGTDITAGVFKTDRTTKELGDAVQVMPSTDPNKRYFKLRSRLFTDKDLALKEDLDSIVSGSVYKGAYDADTDTPSLPNGSDLLGDFYRVSVSGNGYEVGDILIYNETSYDHIPVKAVTQGAIENSSLKVYDIYVKADYVGTTNDGTSLYPYNSIDLAIASANDGDSIFLDGEFIITASITLPSDKSLYFYGNDLTAIKYASFDGTNDKVFYQSSSSCTKEYFFDNIKFSNSGDYAIYIRSAKEVKFTKCELFNNGWSGNDLSTVLADDGTTLGYDSDQADLQSFWAGSETSNGGAMRIRSTAIVNIVDCEVYNNLRGLRIQDCGVGGYGYISRNQCYNNLESGIYLASGSYNASNGCENFTVYNNASKYNSNNGILVIGGINNIISLNVVEGNWNAGVMGWHVSNTRFRDMDLSDNNRSEFNGIGNTGDAHASISIAGGTINADADYIADVLDTQIYNTGLGSNTSRVGLRISSNVSDINDSDKSLINIDDVGFKNQDYAVDVECDLSKVRLTLGDCRYIDTVEKNVRVATGNYFELPFSNHSTSVKDLDIVLNTLKQTVALHEGINGNVINVYNVNELQSIQKTNSIDIIQKGSDKIQLSDLTLGHVFVDGVQAGVNLQTMNDTINSAFSMTLQNYQTFLGTGNGGGSSTSYDWYYIESPDGEFNYPLFKDETEANAVDLAEGGIGSSSIKTYTDDLTNTDWYMPNTNSFEAESSAPNNGVYGTFESVVWNIQETDVDSNYAPTFTDMQQDVMEGSSVNIVYKQTGDTDTYNITNIPTGYADNGTAIIGTADTITDGIDIQHVLNVTRANNYGSDSGTLTIDVLNDVSNDDTDISIGGSDTPFTKAMSFDGSNDYLRANPSSSQSNPLYMYNQSGGTTVNSGETWSNSQPWTVSVWFKCTDSNTSNERAIWTQGNTAGGVMLTRKNGKLNFKFGSTYNNLEFTSTDNINTDEWYGINVQYDGGLTGASSSDINDYYSRFTISRVMATGSVSEVQGTWTHSNYGFNNKIDVYFYIGQQFSSKYFMGEVAACTLSTLPQGVALLTDEEIAWHCNNPKKFMEDVMTSRLWRKATYNNASGYVHNNANTHKYVNSLWCGDGVYYGNPETWNSLKNQSYTNTSGSTYRWYSTNMVSSNLVNATPED